MMAERICIVCGKAADGGRAKYCLDCRKQRFRELAKINNISAAYVKKQKMRPSEAYKAWKRVKKYG